MKLDPTVLKDWEIAQAAEPSMKPFVTLGQELGLREDELIPMGRQLGKIDFMRAISRLRGQPQGKYVDVTAITPTPLGEGKTTTTMALTQGLGKIGKRVVATIRQPSGGPTFNVKGSGPAAALPNVFRSHRFRSV